MDIEYLDFIKYDLFIHLVSLALYNLAAPHNQSK